METPMVAEKGRINIICIEGPHGSGKTSLCELLKSRGYKTIEEGFLDMPKTCLSPQGFTMETIWLANWVRRILEITEPGSYYVDRSPFSALIYAKSGGLLRECIDEMLNELADADRFVTTVYLEVSNDVLWNRISERLYREPDRVKYNEDKVDWMRAVLYKYSKVQWDYYINADDDIEIVFDSLLNL
jgi:thymidylate kinase